MAHYITRLTAQCRSCELYEIVVLNTDKYIDIPNLVLIVVQDYFDVGVGNVNSEHYQDKRSLWEKL